MPRGTSIIGLDLRKTKLRPLFVPDPPDDIMDYAGFLELQVLVTSLLSPYLMQTSPKLHTMTTTVIQRLLHILTTS